MALPGAVIPANQEVLKRSKIRGVESEGMMCSYDELAIEAKDANYGIIEVPENIPLTTHVGEVLNFEGGFLDVSITPNRGDCFSVKGIARDLAAAGAGQFIDSPVKNVSSEFSFPISIVKEDNKRFSEYVHSMAFRVIRNVKNTESPEWLKSKLKSANVNCISSVVDIANFCMLDMGAPFQVYDLDKIEKEMCIRFAERNEKFVDFSGKEYRLQQDMLISEDASHVPLCLLGIKSGDKIACDENTKNVLIEAAVFNPVNIAEVGMTLDATSDSRTRFERGVDKAGVEASLEIISHLMIDTCGGQASEIFVLENQAIDISPIQLTSQKLQSVSGCCIPLSKAKEILIALGLKVVSENNDSITFISPSWRYDLNIEEDLIEEILRINGYDNIEGIPLTEVSVGEDALLELKCKQINLRKVLAFRKMSEVVAYSFTKKEYAKAFQENKKLIYLINPISSDLEVMRPSLIPNLLQTAVRSLNYGESSVGIFELGNVFFDNCEQQTQISGIRAGNANSSNWLNKKRKFDVFDAKADLCSVLSFYGLKEKNLKIEPKAPAYYHPSRSGTVILGKKVLGYFGELHPKINKIFGISERIVCFEVLIDAIENNKAKSKIYLNRVFPKIERDFSFIFKKGDIVGGIVNGIYKLDERIVKVDIFDSFEMNSTQKSIGVTIMLDAVTRTLTEEEATEVSHKVIKYVESFGGKLRS